MITSGQTTVQTIPQPHQGEYYMGILFRRAVMIGALCPMLPTAYAQVPTISSFSPTSGPIGTSVTITGTNFNTTAAANKVYFGAVKALTNSATSTSLGVSVPVGATFAPISVTDTTKGLTAYSSAPFVVTFPSSRIIDTTSFASKVDFTTGTSPYSVAIGDIDGDGKPDLIVANNGGSTVSVMRNTVPLLAAPQNLALIDSSSQRIAIRWNKSPENNILRYRIFRSTSPGATTQVDSSSNGSDTTKIFNGLINGTRYYFRVAAVDSLLNQSAYSNEVSGTPTGALSVENRLNSIPKEYSLLQSYPNPFNPSTTMRYGLPAQSRVQLRIYDILGHLVADLVNTEQAAGWNQVVWNANVASGLYFYRLEAVSVSDPNKRFVDVKKMLLLK
jgi:hypothetical protein